MTILPGTPEHALITSALSAYRDVCTDLIASGDGADTTAEEITAIDALYDQLQQEHKASLIVNAAKRCAHPLHHGECACWDKAAAVKPGTSFVSTYYVWEIASWGKLLKRLTHF